MRAIKENNAVRRLRQRFHKILQKIFIPSCGARNCSHEQLAGELPVWGKTLPRKFLPDAATYATVKKCFALNCSPDVSRLSAASLPRRKNF